MKHNLTEILKAIKVIQDECRNSLGCSECPFYVKSRCGVIQDEPHTWELNNDEWKAFKC